MSDITREYLDKKLDKLASKQDIVRLETKIVGLETKIETEVGRLETKIEEEVADLAGMMSRRFDEIEKKLDVREEVDQLKVQMTKVWHALNIKS